MSVMDSNDPTFKELARMTMDGNVPIIGGMKMAQPVILQAPDGSQVVVPQVFVSQMNIPIMQEIAARSAVAAAQEVRKELLSIFAEYGIIPAQQQENKPNDAEPLEQPPGNGEAGAS